MSEKELLEKIIKLVHDTPNNYELGDKIRKIIWDEKIVIKK